MTNKIIRKGLRLLAAFAVAVALSGCEMLPFEAFMTPEVLAVTPSTVTPNALHGSIYVSVQCDLKWKVELSDVDWAKIENVVYGSDNTGSFNITLSPNMEKASRELTLTVKAGKGFASSRITQQGVDKFFNPGSISLSGTEKVKVQFKAPCDWNAGVVAGKDWLSMDVAQGHAGDAYLTCYAKDRNENIGSREGLIKVKFGAVMLELPVVQAQTDVILSDNTPAEVDWKGGEFTVYTQTNVQYAIQCSADWVRHTATKALNEALESFTVDPNESTSSRTATITFKGGDATYAVSLTQNGKDPFLNISAPGFYGIKGVDYLLGQDGWNQAGRKASAGGKLDFRLMNRANLSVISVTGIQANALEGDSVAVGVVLETGNTETLHTTYNCTVIGQNEDLLWLKAQPSTCFIVKK